MADTAFDARSATGELELIFDQIASRAIRQERRYGPFPKDVAGVRLALAVLQDELDESLLAWRDERKRWKTGWVQTTDEVMDVAAIALRLLMAIGADRG